MKNIFLSFLLLGALLMHMANVSILAVNASADPNSISYLQSLIPDDWNTMALSAAGAVPANLNHLKSVSGNKATDYARSALAITATGNDPRTFGNVDIVTKLKNDFYSNNQIGDPSLVNDDVWGVMALVSAGESTSDSVVSGARTFILNAQNADGGWSYAVGLSSDTNDTAVAIMALLSSGVNKSDGVITSALSYLKNAQNTDGGFPFTSGSESDAGSDSWVISAITKAGQNPEEWTVEGKSPLDHLQTLKNGNGSYRWLVNDSKEYPIMSSYAVIALSGTGFPVRIISPNPVDDGDQNGDQNDNARTIHYRIEGSTSQVCSGSIDSKNAMDIITDAAQACGYDYEIIDTQWGPYLQSVGGDDAQGLNGWMYLVNHVSPLIGAADYELVDGDSVIWFFGEFSDEAHKPTRISLSKAKVNPLEPLSLTVEYFENGNWILLPNTTITIGGKDFLIQNGIANVSLDKRGIFTFWYEGPDGAHFVRSEQRTVKVGVDTSQEVGVSVNVIQGSGNFEPDIAFTVSDDAIDFTSLEPGNTRSKSLTVQNVGNVNVRIETNVEGDTLFTDPGNLTLNDVVWSEFTIDLGTQQEKQVLSTLSIPSTYKGVGVKNGKIIFWATQNN